MRLQIAPATLDDAEDILRIQRLAFHSEALLHQSFDIPPLRQSLDSLRNDFSVYTFYRACLDNLLVGSAKVRMLESGALWIGRVVVHPDHQGKGVGSQIMNYIEKAWPRAIEFELFTAEKSQHNLDFYNRLGYIVQSRFTEAEHSDIILVKLTKKNLPSPPAQLLT